MMDVSLKKEEYFSLLAFNYKGETKFSPFIVNFNHSLKLFYILAGLESKNALRF